MYNISYARKSSSEKSRQIQSIPDQMEWVSRVTTEQNVTIDRHFQDKGSAKDIGREGFEDMIKYIRQCDEPVTIWTWGLSRLTRNPLEDGILRHLLLKGKIYKIVTSERVYDQNENQAMLGGAFGEGTEYSRKLSKDVTRGMKGKVNNGWRPTMAPGGYLNDPHGLKGEKQIFTDEETWDRWRRMWDIGLTGNYSVPELMQKAHDMGLRARGGKPLALSTMYKFFANPFYAGIIKWNGMTVQGAHKPMVTLAEFERMQEIIHRGNKKRNRVHENPYAGLIKCAECGGMITADSPKFKKNKSDGKVRIYYYMRCTKKKGICSQQYLRREALEEQIVNELGQVVIPDKLQKLVFKQLELKHFKESEASIHQRAVLQRELNNSKAKEAALMNKLLEGVVDNEAYTLKQSELKKETIRLAQALEEQIRYSNKWLVNAKAIFNFAIEAPKAFQKTDGRGKRRILTGYGSNFSMSSKELHLQAILPFERIKSSIKKSELILEVLEPERTRMQMRKNLLNEGLSVIWSG